MCGIAGLYFKQPLAPEDYNSFVRFSKHVLLGIEERGKHATGYVAVARDGKVTMDKSDVKASEFIVDMEDLPMDPWYVLFHTRFATKGDVKDYRNNHPVIYGTCFTTHNGSISNDDDLFEARKFHRYAEVDTEILPAIVGTTDFDPERIPELFKDVEGACAMATIDPVNHPGKVLLLRTEKSPLNIIDTPKFTAWASTTNCIREAWGKVLGTPPKYDKFKFIPEYRYMILDGSDEAVATMPLIEPPKKTYVSGGYAQGGFGKAGQIWDREKREWVDKAEMDKRTEERKKANTARTEVIQTRTRSFEITSTEVRERVSALRGNGDHKTTTWLDGRQEPIVGRTWFYCHICNDSVLPEDEVQTLQRGRMCRDCADMYNTIYSERCKEAEKDPNPDEDGDEFTAEIAKLVPIELKNKINKWGEDEEMIHQQVLEFLSEATGLSEEALDYIMFRANMRDLDDNIPMVTLIEKLWDQYDTEYESLWEEVDPAGTGAFVKLVKRPEESPKSSSTRRQDSIKSHFSNGNAKKRPHKCLFCRKRPKLRLLMADRTQDDFGYCNQHFDKCSVKGCNDDANHTRKDGVRVCHEHARGMKECYADTWARNNGYAIEEV